MVKNLFLAAIGGLCACISAAPSAADTAPKNPKTAVAAPVAGEAGVRAYADPETGAVTARPASPQQDRALAFPPIDMSKIKEIRNADGSTTWLHENVQEAIVATRGSDGRIALTCAEHGVVDDHVKTAAQEVANDR